MKDCGNCRHINHLGLPDWSTMPCAVCARYGADNAPTMWEAKPQTNYDRIISKTPEELAKMLSSSGKYFCHGNGYDPHSERCDLGEECEICWLDWLRQEAT